MPRVAVTGASATKKRSGRRRRCCARWIEQYGVPLALYTDWKNVYVRAGDRGGAGRRPGAPDAIRPHVRRAADSDHSGELAASQRARGAESRHAPGSPGQETAAAGDRGGRGRRMRFSRRPTGRSTTRALPQAPAAAADFHRRCPVGDARWTGCFGSKRRERSATTGSCAITIARCSWRGKVATRRRAARSPCVSGPTAGSPIEYRGRTMPWTEMHRPAIAEPGGARGRAARAARRGRRTPPIIHGGEATKASARTSHVAGRRSMTTEPMDAAGAVDAKNAPTAPWKTTRTVFHERPQASSHFSFKGDISIELTQGTFLTAAAPGACTTSSVGLDCAQLDGFLFSFCLNNVFITKRVLRVTNPRADGYWLRLGPVRCYTPGSLAPGCPRFENRLSKAHSFKEAP